MPSQVYYGSPRQARLEAKETLPAKLDLILERLHLRERVKGETVAIKMHVGNDIVYSTIHPVFVRKVVKAIKDGGGKPFIADVVWDVEGAEGRGYTPEVLGCPIFPAALGACGNRGPACCRISSSPPATVAITAASGTWTARCSTADSTARST